MSIAELLRIAIPLLAVAALLTAMVGFVRRRSAARERALQELAARHGLKYTSGGKDLFQGSWPGKVSGSYRGRSLTLHYHNEPSMTRQGYERANYSIMLEMSVRNPQVASLALAARRFGSPADHTPPGDLFERYVVVTSKPDVFAARLLTDPALRGRLAGALAPDWLNPGRINLVRTGRLIFTRGSLYRSSADLSALVEVLGDLADAIEALPERTDRERETA